MTSTGKDSTVVLDLVYKVTSNVKVMFNNTTCDAADTYRIVKKHSDWIITTPEEGIYTILINQISFQQDLVELAVVSTKKVNLFNILKFMV